MKNNKKDKDELNESHLKQIIRRKMIQRDHGDNTLYKRNKKWLNLLNGIIHKNKFGNTILFTYLCIVKQLNNNNYETISIT